MRLIRCLAAVAIVALSSAAFAEQIDNPEYAQWSKYKAGTFITMQQTTEMPSMPQMAAMMPQTKVTTKLTEVKPESLTLEVTSTTTSGGQSRDTKVVRTIPAKIEKPAATNISSLPDGTTVEMKDLKEGKETIEVKGKKLETMTREFTSVATVGRGGAGAGAPAGMGVNSKMKTWSSAEIPGGMVKTETTSTMEMGEIKMNMLLLDYTVVK